MHNKLRIIIGYLYILITSIMLLTLSIIILVNNTILNESYITNKINKSNYTKELYKDIKKEMTYYTEQSGFKDTIIDETFTEEEINNNIQELIKNLYQGKSTNINTSLLEERLNKKITNYLEQENFTITNKEEIDKFVKEMSNIYINKTISYTNKLSTIIPKIKTISNTIIIILTAILLILITINKFIFPKVRTSITLFTNTFLLIAINLYIKNRIDINHLLIYNKSLSNIIINIINQILTQIIYLALIYFVLGLILDLIRKINKVSTLRRNIDTKH